MEIGGYLIPAGTNCNIPNGVMHKDARFFGERADEFRPERFLGNSPAAENARKSWMPFGEHTRMCVGFTFALVEIKAMLFTILTRSSVELEDPTDPGDVLLEAGVNAPARHAHFYFRERDLRKIREEENLRGWMEQTAALDKMNKQSNVAPTA
jgi:cytochrome P450